MQGSEHPPHSGAEQTTKGFRWYHVTLLLIGAVTVAVAVTVWVMNVYVFPSEFKPVQLSQQEQQTLSAKLERLERLTPHTRANAAAPSTLEPKPYSEHASQRTVRFSEREINALMANNTDLARRVAIDLADGLISARLLINVHPDFPVLGGRTVKVHAGLEVTYAGERPRVVIRGVSLWGVPLPDAWLGGLKNVDLVEEYGRRPGFWKSFADGLDGIQVEEGAITVRMKE